MSATAIPSLQFSHKYINLTKHSCKAIVRGFIDDQKKRFIMECKRRIGDEIEYIMLSLYLDAQQV